MFHLGSAPAVLAELCLLLGKLCAARQGKETIMNIKHSPSYKKLKKIVGFDR